jgi:hypothetical protein
MEDGVVVMEAEAQPETILNELRSYASRELNRLGREASCRRRGARHAALVGSVETRMCARLFNRSSRSRGTDGVFRRGRRQRASVRLLSIHFYVAHTCFTARGARSRRPKKRQSAAAPQASARIRLTISSSVGKWPVSFLE